MSWLPVRFTVNKRGVANRLYMYTQCNSNEAQTVNACYYCKQLRSGPDRIEPGRSVGLVLEKYSWYVGGRSRRFDVKMNWLWESSFAE